MPPQVLSLCKSGLAFWSITNSDIFFLTSSLSDVFEYLEHVPGSFTAWGALAAGFVLSEAYEVVGHFDHTGVFIHDDHASRAHH